MCHIPFVEEFLCVIVYGYVSGQSFLLPSSTDLFRSFMSSCLDHTAHFLLSLFLEMCDRWITLMTAHYSLLPLSECDVPAPPNKMRSIISLILILGSAMCFGLATKMLTQLMKSRV